MKEGNKSVGKNVYPLLSSLFAYKIWRFSKFFSSRIVRESILASLFQALPAHKLSGISSLKSQNRIKLSRVFLSRCFLKFSATRLCHLGFVCVSQESEASGLEDKRHLPPQDMIICNEGGAYNPRKTWSCYFDNQHELRITEFIQRKLSFNSFLVVILMFCSPHGIILQCNE